MDLLCLTPSSMCPTALVASLLSSCASCAWRTPRSLLMSRACLRRAPLVSTLSWMWLTTRRMLTHSCKQSLFKALQLRERWVQCCSGHNPQSQAKRVSKSAAESHANAAAC